MALPFTTDCSGFATMMARWSGAADPNGFGFNGYGNTLTFLRLEVAGGPLPPPNPNPYCPLAVDGDFGPQTTKALQWKLGVAQDGI